MVTDTTHVLPHRAVNLGSTNKVPMKRLIDVLQAQGAGKPNYLLQSGNPFAAPYGGSVQVAFWDDPVTVELRAALLVPERLDRVEPRRSGGG